MSAILDRQIKCLAREVALRKSVYPKWIASGRMKQDEADDEIAAMEGALKSLEFMKKYEPVIRSAVRLVLEELKPFTGAGLDIDESAIELRRTE